MSQPADGRAGIDARLVQRLVSTQFPQWAGLSVTPVEVDGWDNRTYRLGADMTVRLPTHERYAAAIDKEHRWLPVLAPLLPVPIPVPLAKGNPTADYPWNWSIRRWLDGTSASRDPAGDLPGLAVAVADVILALRRIETTGGPTAGAHSFFRGCPLSHYDDETRRCLADLDGRIDTRRAAALWDAALAAPWNGPPVWFHGDVASGNLLVKDHRLAAVIDFGTSGVGDPACDLVIAWTLFTGASRRIFRERLAPDAAAWARARGWVLWKALIGLARDIDVDQPAALSNRRLIDDVLADDATAATA